MVSIFNLHVSRQLIRQATHFAPAHGIGLSGERKRPHARSTDAAGVQMAINNAVDLVGAAAGLIDALGEHRERALGLGELLIKCTHLCLREAAFLRHLPDGGRAAARRHQGRLQSLGTALDKLAVGISMLFEVNQQAVEQDAIGPRARGQMPVRDIAGGGTSRVDDHNAQGGIVLFCLGHALKQYWMTPGGVRTHQHDELCLFQVGIAARHAVGAEGALVAGYRRRHAKARIGVDIGAAEVTLHQFVGDVIILRQQLAGDIKRHRVRPVFTQHPRVTLRHGVQRLLPGPPFTAYLRIQQTPIEIQGIRQRRALGTQPPVIGRMLRVALDRHRTAGIDFRQHATTDAAIGTGSACYLIRHARVACACKMPSPP